jgi:hypothetical protein
VRGWHAIADRKISGLRSRNVFHEIAYINSRSVRHASYISRSRGTHIRVVKSNDLSSTKTQEFSAPRGRALQRKQPTGMDVGVSPVKTCVLSYLQITGPSLLVQCNRGPVSDRSEGNYQFVGAWRTTPSAQQRGRSYDLQPLYVQVLRNAQNTNSEQGRLSACWTNDRYLRGVE